MDWSIYIALGTLYIYKYGTYYIYIYIYISMVHISIRQYFLAGAQWPTFFCHIPGPASGFAKWELSVWALGKRQKTHQWSVVKSMGSISAINEHEKHGTWSISSYLMWQTLPRNRWYKHFRTSEVHDWVDQPGIWCFGLGQPAQRKLVIIANTYEAKLGLS